MPLYEYRCKTCGDHFDQRRPLAEADATATCPAGHTGADRLLAAFAATGRASGFGSAPAPEGAGCGSACACYPE